MNIGTNIPDSVKMELNLAISEAARTYQEENNRSSESIHIRWLNGSYVPTC